MLWNNDLDLFVVERLGQFPSQLKDWISEATLTASIKSELEIALDYTTNIAAAESSLNELDLPDLAPKDVLSALITEEYFSALCSVRFLGGDPSKPFIEVDGFSAKTDKHLFALQRLGVHLTNRYEILKPQSMRFLHGNESDLSKAMEKLQVRIDQHIYAARVSDLIEHQDASATVSQSKAKDLTWYDEYTREYEKLLVERPVLRSLIQPECSDEISDAVADNLCSLAFVANKLSGVIIGQREVIAGIPCIEIVERFLFQHARGHGYGRQLVAGFTQTFSIPPETVILGRISPENIWSIGTAEESGRILLASYSFVDI